MALHKAIAANSIYRFFNIGIQLLSTVLLSRLMGIEGYGLISLVIATVAIFNMATSLGLDSAITYHIASGKLKLQHIYWLIGVILLVQVGLAIVTEAASFLITGNHFLAITLPVLLVFVISTSLTEKLTALLNGFHFYTLLNRWLVIINAIMLLVWGVLWFGDAGWQTHNYVLLYVILSALQTLVLLVVFRIASGQGFSFIAPAKAQLRLFAAYAFVEYLANVIQFVAYRADYWILDHYYDKKELGWYALAVKLSQFFWVLPNLIGSILFPVVSNQLPGSAPTQVTQLIRIMNLSGLLLLIICACTAGFIIPWVFGEAFTSSAPLLLWLLPGVWLYSITVVLGGYFSGIYKPEVTLYSAAICLSTILIFDFWLIPGMGKTGAAIASTIAYSITAFYNIYKYCSLTQQSFTQLFIPQRDDMKRLREMIYKAED
ncbi:MAG: oligosaccharide flippase family protein [Chitinophagaceae bacterium]